ncbi:MAG: Stress responsive alpha-beta barrel domain protein [Verrucomicrobia bacterium]|nr:Stress responsive alpha-beta barrel domain protein [Verrucomicrobiota bacterium]
MKKLLAPLLSLLVLTFASSLASAADTAPKSVIHVVTLAWKDGATPEQIQAALDGVKALPAAFPGITHVWVKSIKVQNAKGIEKPKTHAFVMEFADEAALKAYADSPAQKEWYKTYLAVRGQSTTFDITN